MSNGDNVERRVELAAKVSMLEERSVQNQKHLERIEEMLLKHADAEETLMHGILKQLVEFKDDVNERVETQLAPIRDELSRYQTAIKVLSTIGIGVWAVIAMFKDEILRWFGH